MTANSLYGRLTADLTNEYRHRCDVMHKHSHLINRFGDVVGKLGLTPHVNPAAEGEVNLVALSHRGADSQQLLQDVITAGFTVGEVLCQTLQFNDGYPIWRATVKGHGLVFCLVFYTAGTPA